MQALLPLFVGLSLASDAGMSRMRARDWLSLDLYHVSRTVPALSRTLGTPIDPGLQAGYHHAWLGDAVTGGTSLQLAIANYDQLFWSLSAGGGLEGVWRTESGLYLGLGSRLDYARIFTGRNDFVWDEGRYRQVTDGGRGFLRATPVELTLGYSPQGLRDLGIVADSIAAAANRNFNAAYTSLLRVLHELFNGQNTAATFQRALALMMSMKEQAKGMMSAVSNYGQVHIGPSFEYQDPSGG